jgi:hypothetical protein
LRLFYAFMKEKFGDTEEVTRRKTMAE